MTSLSLVYPFDEVYLTESLKVDEKLRKLTVTNALSTQKIIELLKSLSINQPRVVEVFTSDEIDTARLQCEAHQYLSRKHLVSFESSSGGEAWIFWKAPNDHFYSIKVDDVTLKNVVEDFLMEAMEKNYTGVAASCSENKQILLTNLEGFEEDLEGFNLLIFAIKMNNLTAVKALLALKMFNIHSRFKEQSAIDIAWKAKHFDIVFTLLMANSTIPTAFNKTSASEEIKMFANDSEELHQLIKNHHAKKSNNIEKIKAICKKYPELKHFYVLQRQNDVVVNESAPWKALSERKLDIYEVLGAHGVTVAETDSFKEIFKVMKPRIRDIHKRISLDVSEKKYLMTLVLNSFVGFDNDGDRLALVTEAFQALDDITDFRSVLKLTAAFKKFQIFFDFHRESTYFLTPVHGEKTEGVFELNGGIYIAAKKLLKECTRHEVIGTLAHELYHLAMEIVYRNYAKPYSVGDLKAAEEFEEITKECEVNQHTEDIVKWVFEYYKEGLHHTELAVRIAHMKAFYHRPPGASDFHENEEILSNNLRTFDSLNQYYQKVLADIENSIEITSKLSDCDTEIQYSHLTPQLKMKIQNSEINFQDEAIEVSKLISCDSDALNHLSSAQIRDIIDYNSPEISKAIELDLDVYVERKFVLKFPPRNPFDDVLGHSEAETDEELNNRPRSSVEIIRDFQCTQSIIILTDFAGAGKTTAFKKLVKTLKGKFPELWVEYVDLKRHFKAYEEAAKKNLTDLNTIAEFIAIKMLKIKNFELAIFKQLFKAGNTILLFDGVDEISPNFNDFIKNLFVNIASTSSNKMWISTRPECAEALEKTFTLRSLEFYPYTVEERSEFFDEYFKMIELRDDFQERKKVALKCVELMEKGSKDDDRDVHNPLILRMIAEVSVDHDLSKELNFYSLFDLFLPKKFNIVSKKGEVVVQTYSRMTSCLGLSIQQVHLVYAINLLYNGVVKALEFCRRKIRWTNEEISRYGILHVESIEYSVFAHRNFAEFLVALYLVVYIHNSEDEPDLNEASARLTLLFYSWQYLPEVVRFIESYLDLQNDENSNFNCIFEKVISGELELAYDPHPLKFRLTRFMRQPATIRSVCRFFARSPKILRTLWMLDEVDNLIILILKEFSSNMAEVCQIARESLGEEVVREILQPAKKASFLFYTWIHLRTTKPPKKSFFDSFMDINENQYAKFSRSKKIQQFLVTLKDLLTLEEFKQFFFKHLIEIFHQIKQVNDLSHVWEVIEKNLSRNEIVSLLKTRFTSKQLPTRHERRVYVEEITNVDLIETKKTLLQDVTIWTNVNAELPKKLCEILGKYLNGDDVMEMISCEYTTSNKYDTKVSREKNCLVDTLSFYIGNNSITYWSFMEKILNEDQQRQVLNFALRSPIEVTFLDKNPKIFVFFYNVYENLFPPNEIRRVFLRRFKEDEVTPDLLKYKHSPMVYKILLNTSLDDEKHASDLAGNLGKTHFYFNLMRNIMTDEEITLLNEVILQAEREIEELRIFRD